MKVITWAKYVQQLTIAQRVEIQNMTMFLLYVTYVR